MLKRLASFSAAFVLSLSALFTLAMPSAFADPIGWEGTTGGDLNTAADWAGDSRPTSADTAVFTTGSSSQSLVNNGTLTFGGIQFTGSGLGNFTLNGPNAITLNGNIVLDQQNKLHTIKNNLVLSATTHTINVAAGATLVLDGNLSGVGAAITKTGAGTLVLAGENTFTGAVIVSGGVLTVESATALGSGAGTTTVNDGASFYVETCDSVTIAENFVFAGESTDPDGDFPTPKLSLLATCENAPLWPGDSYYEGSLAVYGTPNITAKSVTLNGSITLQADLTIGNYTKALLTGALSGDFAITALPGYGSQLVINGSANATKTPNSTYKPAVFKKTLSDSQEVDLEIYGNTEISITGSRGLVTLNGGTLKGTGTIGALEFLSGTLAPGLSPGMLNTGTIVFSGGTHEVELGGTTAGQYDQLNVTGQIDLGAATTLSTSLYGDFKPAVGNAFTIINNDSNDVVNGRFVGLAEGATFTVGGYVFRISYVGGDGNDVVLTVQSVPSAPDTGMQLITANPLFTAGISILSASILLGIARKYRTVRR